MCMFILIQQGRWKSGGWDSRGNSNPPLAPRPEDTSPKLIWSSLVLRSLATRHSLLLFVHLLWKAHLPAGDEIVFLQIRQRSATCIGQSQPADELGNVTYLMYLIGCGYPSGKMPYFSRSGDE